MDNLIISFMEAEAKSVNPDHLFGILNLNTHEMEWIKLSHLPNTDNFVHGMGICYNENYFCAGIIPLRERLASNILTIDLTTGKKIITYLYFTKAIHGVKSIDKNRLLVNSTQTDVLVELIINKGHIVNEDLYHHFVPSNKWDNCKQDLNKEYKSPYYRMDKYIDDHSHVNSIAIKDGYTYVSMFIAFEEQMYGETFKGILYDVFSQRVILDNLNQPHTIYFDSKNRICCCDSAQFTFIIDATNNKNKKEIPLDGYTRGIIEDKDKGGYWIGISAYRKRNTFTQKWVEKYKGEQPLKGARIQFVTYDGVVTETIELAHYGKEIFDLLPHKKGVWNV